MNFPVTPGTVLTPTMIVNLLGGKIDSTYQLVYTTTSPNGPATIIAPITGMHSMSLAHSGI